MKQFYLLILFIALGVGVSNAQLNVAPNQTAIQLVDMLVGAGVTYTNPQLTCPQNASGSYTNGATTSILIDSGIVLTSGRFNTQGANVGVNAPGASFASNNTNTTGGDADLANAASGQFYDLCKLEFDFVPIGDTIQFRYRFGSEEYPQYNCSNFNDIFAFFISGPGYAVPTNVALVPGTNIPVAINSINGGQNLGPACTNMGPGSPFTALYVNNAASPNIVYNGLTTILTAKTNVTPCSTYHMKFAIADVFDHIFDSGVFLEAGSFQSGAATVSAYTSSNTLSTVPTSIEGCTSGSVTIKRPTAAPYNQLVQLFFGGTAINGVDIVTIPNSITIPAYDSQVVINVAAIQDNFIEGTETFTIYMSGNNCSPAISDSIQFTILEQPNYTVSLDDTICLGDTKILNATPNPTNGNITFNWTPLGSTAPTSGTSVSTSPTVNTTYTVTAVYPGCPDRDSTVDITVEPTPTLSTAVTPITCFGDNNGTITATANVTFSPMQISLSPGAQNQSTSPALFNNLSPATYTVTVTSAAGCTITSLAPITQPPIMSWTSALGSAIPCNVSNIGTIDVSATGGVPTINYSLNPTAVSNTTGNFTGLGPANYTVTATDANNCTITTIVAVTQQTPMFWQPPTVVDIDCFGNNNGSIAITATGGVGAINYNLQPPNTSNGSGTFLNLGPATYTVSATDANNCTLTSAITINEPPLLVWTTQTVNDILCFGANDGSISYTANGGTGTINYTLQPNNISNTSGSFSNLGPGNYTITGTDSNNCFINSAFSITQAPQLLIANVTTTNPSCVPGNDGSITVTASGGTPTYQYSIGGSNQAGNSFTNLGAGNYVVIVTDANNCTVSSSVAINAPNAPVINTMAITNNSCFGGTMATISTSASGGLNPLSYNLQLGNVTNGTGNYTSLSAGTYTVTVSDAIGCTNSSTVNIVDPPQLLWNTTTATDVLCFGENSGTITTSTTGGTGQINYNLQPNNISNGTGSFINLLANNYTVIATDANGCLITTTFTIANPPQLTWGNTVSTNVICNGANDGTISVLSNGGTGLINYNLQPTNTTNNTGNFTTLSAGAYTVTATDANNCTISTAFNIIEPTAINITNVISTTPTCVPGTDATITITAAGGTPALQYNIGGANQASNIFNNVGAGAYVITVTDANNCTLTSAHTVSAPITPNWTVTINNNVLCNGGNTGNIVATANGLGVITYNLQPNNVTNNTGSFNNLPAGNYVLTATDAAGCDTSYTFVITEPNALQWISALSSDVNCFGGNDGAISIFASGGTGVINYNLAPNNITNAVGSFSNLTQGSYTVTATDANNCTLTTTFNITQPTLLQITNVTSTIPTCVPGNDAQITINAQGGTPNYLYNNGGFNQTNNIITNMGAGNYTITVTDANSCTVTSIISITNPNSPTWSNVSSQDVSCNGGTDGTITSNATGGTGLINYNLQPGNISNASGNFINLPANNYTISAIDAIGCSVVSIVTINEPNAISFNTPTVINVSCNGLSTASINQPAIGGTGPLSYNLQPGNISNGTGLFPNLNANNYTITVTDANACTESVQINITEPALLAWDNFSITNVNCAGGDDGSINGNLIGGTPVYSYTLLPNNITNNSGIFNTLTAGTYTVNALDANGCTNSSIAIITEPAGIVITSNIATDVICNGQNDGSITLTVSGGTNPMIYTLQPTNQQNNTGSFPGLGGNNYTITLTDANNCTLSTLANVAEPPTLIIDSTVINNVSCNGNNDASIAHYVSGGLGAITYTLNPGALTNNTGAFNNLSPASYTIVASDANNCSISSIVNITEPTLLIWDSAIGIDILCAGGTDGVITVGATGGTPSYNFNLQPTNTNNTTGQFTNLSAATYTITTTDANSCSITTTLIISEPPPIVSSYVSTDVTCFGEANGTVVVTSNGGVNPLSFNLLPNNISNNTGSFTNLIAGTYTVIITDSNACADTINNATVIEPPQIQFTNITTTDVRCYGGSDGEISLIGVGGNSQSLTYSIAPNVGTQPTPGTFNNLPVGSYTIYAQDSLTCSDSVVVIIDQNPPILIGSVAFTSPRCFGETNGTMTITASGGVGNLSFQLNSTIPSTTGVFGNLGGGNYLITITDDLGCTKDSMVTLNEPALLQLETDVQNVTCQTSADGIILANGIGGNGTYTYYIRPGISLNRTGAFGSLAIGTYTISVRDTLGCQADTIAFVGLPANPLEVVMDKKNLGCYGFGNEGWAEAITYGGQPPYTYLWSTTPAQTESKASNLYFGYYQVLVTDSKGCQIKDSVYVEPGPCCDAVFFPNAFSPNGDGKNDRFRMLTSAGVELKQLEVYNRWGQRIWSTTDYKQSWDGTFQGEYCQLETYYYVFAYKCLTDGRDYIKKGDVILVR